MLHGVVDRLVSQYPGLDYNISLFDERSIQCLSQYPKRVEYLLVDERIFEVKVGLHYLFQFCCNLGFLYCCAGSCTSGEDEKCCHTFVFLVALNLFFLVFLSRRQKPCLSLPLVRAHCHSPSLLLHRICPSLSWHRAYWRSYPIL